MSGKRALLCSSARTRRRIVHTRGHVQGGVGIIAQAVGSGTLDLAKGKATFFNGAVTLEHLMFGPALVRCLLLAVLTVEIVLSFL